MVLEGKGQYLERKSSSRGNLGISCNETNMGSLGRKEADLPAGDHAGDVGLAKLVLEGALNLQPLNNILISLKTEAERWLGFLEMGFDVKGAGMLEGAGDDFLKTLKGKTVVSDEGEDGLGLGRKEWRLEWRNRNAAK